MNMRLKIAAAFACVLAVLVAAVVTTARTGAVVATISVAATIVAGIGIVLFLLYGKSAKELQAVIDATNDMTRGQTQGDIEAYIAVDRFQGAYRTLAEGVNAGVRIHVDNILEFLDLIATYANGDFSPVLPPRPGKQVVANQRMDLLRNNLRQVSAEVQGLLTAAQEGRLGARADAGKFSGDWAKIVTGLNETMGVLAAPVSEATSVLEKLAGRDLRVRMVGTYQGDHAKIKESLNATATALHDAMAQVTEAVGQLSSASEQIASSSQAVAAGASEQASSIEETSASLESMASSTQNSADNAQQANVLAQAAKGAATEGTASMALMQGAMEKIRASAEGTSQIIKDINEIAFQTNLLALNAAVEAARAGEAGRGFAVVAEEVRSLALRSKEAANKTEELIRQSVKEAGEGAATSKKVSDKLTEIAGSIAKVTDIVAEIASASKEQAVGIGQVTKAVSEMDKVTQQNAASSEESSSSAEELSSQSQELAALVAAFRTDRNTSAPQFSPARSPAKPNQKLLVKNGKNGQAKRADARPPKPKDIIPLNGDVPSFKEF